MEHSRGSFAAVAIAHVHGCLAWFLGAAVTVLTPILHWRAMPAEDGPTLGAVPSALQQYTAGEGAIRRLQAALTRIAAA